MTVTIDDMLRALQTPNQSNKLDNTRETWERIGRKDNFSELGLDDGELEQFLKEWIDNNPYSAL
jgi:hypothetical protein